MLNIISENSCVFVVNFNHLCALGALCGYESFMQNKPNFQNAQMNISYCITMNYEQKTMNNANQNKANSNPIKANFELFNSCKNSLTGRNYSLKYVVSRNKFEWLFV